MKGTQVEARVDDVLEVVRRLEKNLRISSSVSDRVNIPLHNGESVVNISLTRNCVIITTRNTKTGRLISHRLFQPYSIYPMAQSDVYRIREGIKRVFKELGVGYESAKPKDRAENEIYDYYPEWGMYSTTQVYVQKDPPKYNKKLSVAISRARSYEEFVRALREYKSIEEDAEADIKVDILE